MSHPENNLELVCKETRTSNGCLVCLEWLTKKLKLVEDGATPPNWKYIGLVFIALFSSASTLTFLFPFLPEMVLTFGYSETEKGTYVGILASSVFAGRIVGSVFWGWMADRYGRKLVLLITIALNGAFGGLFGFSHSLPVAIFFRFMCGVVNGTVGTAKAILYDISDNSNQAVSMSMLSISWGMGMIAGPTAGGLLASPAKKWPHVFSQDGLFGEFPYLLASLFPFICCALIFVIIFFFFDETFVIKRASKKLEKEVDVAEVNGILEGHKSEKNENHLPLLGDMWKDSQTALFQSLHSVSIEADSAAYLAWKLTNKPAESIEHLHPLQRKAHSVSEIATNRDLPPYEKSSGCEKVSQSTSNLYIKHITSVTSKPLTGNSLMFNNKDKNHGEMGHILDTVVVNNERNGSVCVVPISNKEGTIHQKDLDTNQQCWNDEEINTNNSAMAGDKLLLNINGSSKKPIGDKTDLLDMQSDQEEQICCCIESCGKLACCSPCRNTSLYKLLRLSDVWATVMLYTVFSIITIGIEDIFPVFASTTKDYGGLGFSTDEIGLAVGAIFLPLLVLQIKIYPFLVSKFGIRKVFLMSAIVCMITSQCIPMVRILNNHRVWLWICLLGVQIPFKIAANCCFAGTALLINNSVTQELAGQANGLAMMSAAMGRTLAPVLAGTLFSWTVTFGLDIGTPFDINFPFFIIGGLFFVSIFEALHLNPKLDKQKK